MLGNDIKRILQQFRLLLLIPIIAIFLWLSYNDVNLEPLPHPTQTAVFVGAGSLWSPMYGGQGSLFYGIAVFFIAGLIGSDLFLIDKKTGLKQHLIARHGRFKYILSHYVGIFLVTGLLCILPIIINILVTFTRFPFVPTTELAQFPGASDAVAWKQLFYNQWGMFITLYLVRAYLLCGFLGCFCTAISNLTENYYLSLFLPYTVMLGLSFIPFIHPQFGVNSMITVSPLSMWDYIFLILMLGTCIWDVYQQLKERDSL